VPNGDSERKCDEVIVISYDPTARGSSWAYVLFLFFKKTSEDGNPQIGVGVLTQYPGIAEPISNPFEDQKIIFGFWKVRKCGR
jgi:hypothetical protein